MDLRKTYGTGQATVHALAGIDVTFERGRFTAVMGPSGSGKSTLMHCMAGLDRPTSGQTFVGDLDIGRLDDKGLTQMRRDRIGFVFQSFNLVPTLTAGENITLPADLAGKKVDKEWFDYLVGQLGIADRLTHRPTEMSGGQQQRCACARALINRPDLIFADEPTGNLDSNSSAEMLAFLRRSVTEFGQSIVMVTHDPRGAVLRRPGGLPGRRQHRRRDGRPHPRLRPGADRARWAPDMWRVTIKGLLAHKLRLALTALAIVLGVTFIAGTFVLTDTLHNTFDTLFGNIYQNIDFQVRGVAQFGSGGTATRNPVPESLLATVQRVPGVEAADGSVTGYAQYIAPDGKAISTGGAPTLGLSFDPDAQISALRLVQGKDPTTPHAGRDGPRHGAEVRLQGRPVGADPVAGPDPDVHHRRPGALRDGGQPGRRHPGRLRHSDRPGALGEVGQFDTHQRRRPAGRRQGHGPARHRARRCRAASRWSRARPWSTRRRAPSARRWASSTRPCSSSPSSRSSWAASPS